MIWFPYFSSSSLVRGSNIYTIQRASKEDEGSYICKAKSSAGEIEEVLQIIVSEDSNIIEDVSWATPMPFASINSTNPRTNPWKFHEKILRIGGAGKWGFFEAAILNFLSRPFWIFFEKIIRTYSVKWVGAIISYWSYLAVSSISHPDFPWMTWSWQLLNTKDSSETYCLVIFIV